MNDTNSDHGEHVELPRPREATLSARRSTRAPGAGHRCDGLHRPPSDAPLRKEGAEVHALTRPGGSPRPDVAGTTWHRVDLDDREALTTAVHGIAPSVLFHLAGRVEGRRDKALALPMLDANTRVAVALMTAALDLPDCRVVLAGSIEEPRGDEPPVSPYAAAKGATTGYDASSTRSGSCPSPCSVSRWSTGLTSPTSASSSPTSVSAWRTAAPLPEQRHPPVDWVYIADVCDALYRAATSDAPGRVLDIGSGQTATVAEVVTELADIAGYRGILGFGDVGTAATIAHTSPTPDQRLEHLDWRARPAAHGPQWTLGWYRAQRWSAMGADTVFFAGATRGRQPTTRT